MNKTTNDLMKLGFSENDATVYLALAELKTATSNPLITNTGLHRSLVYTSLEHLVARKLISEFETKGKKTFSIVSPDILVEEFEENQKIAESVSKNIIHKMSAETQEITIHKGNDEYLALLTSLIKQLPNGGTKYIIGSGGEDFMEETMRPIWKKYHNAIDGAKITIKMIGYKNQKESFQKETEREGSYKIKYLDTSTENPAGIHVYPEAGVVLNIIYSNREQPVTAIKIKDQNLVKGYLNLFNTLWGN
jgi:sugar-specific transcriptional regulator TrmB